MQDLNDLYYVAAVVDHQGVAAAERALGIPKSRLSRRISQLEDDLGVRLLQRSTRRFAVTEVGHSVYRHAQSMLAEAQAAREVVDRLSAEPRGVIRVSVPVGIAQQQMPRLLPEFLARYPQVRVQLHVSNRRVDIINEGVDVALRVRSRLDDDGSLVMRNFGQIQELLVASPDYLRRMGRGDAGGQAHVVSTVVEQGDAFERDPARAGLQQRYAVVVEREVDTCELVGVLAGQGAEPLGQREVLRRQEVNREVRGAQSHAVGVVGLRQPHKVVLGRDARLCMETHQASGPFALGRSCQHDQWRVDRGHQRGEREIGRASCRERVL